MLDVGEACADVAMTVAELSVDEAAMVGRITMETGVVLGEATGTEAYGALPAGADDTGATEAYGALPAGADDTEATGALELSPPVLPEADPDASEPDEATPLTGPQVPVKVPESEVLRVTSASGPGFG